MPMTRTVISIERELYERARARADQLGMSFAELVRQVLAEKLGEPRRAADPAVIFDLGRSTTPTDIAKDKDAMIGDAFDAQYREREARRER